MGNRTRTKRKTCICQWCNKEFETWTCRPGRFCSKKCAGRYGGSVSPGHPTSPQNYITRQCEVCGKEYTVHKVQVEKRNSRFCSRACMGAAKSLSMQSEGNPNYKGGTVRYRGRNWESQKRQALKRDNNKCQMCGIKGKVGRGRNDLSVHHIKPYREFKGNWLLANNLSNLITLCRVCHEQAERANKNP